MVGVEVYGCGELSALNALPNNAINTDVQSAASLCFCTPVMANVGPPF